METAPIAANVQPRRLANMPLRLARRVLSVEQRRFIKFGIVGASGVFVNLAVVFVADRWLLAALAHQPRESLAIALGILVSIFTNFLMNDRWTWADRASAAALPFWGRCGNFYLASAGAAAVQFAVTFAANASGLLGRTVLGVDLAPIEVTLAALVGIAVATPINYVVNHLWTFRAR
jgi:putative flippase GtrA